MINGSPAMRLAIVLALAAALAGCGGADEKATPGKGAARNVAAPARPIQIPNARQYVALASSGDRFEIETARIALERAEDAEVGGLAQMILSDHERSSARLAEAGAQAQPPLTPEPELDPVQRSAIEALQHARREDFDREWLHRQVLAHQQALDLAIAYARGGDSEPLRRHAAGTISSIQTHLIRARRLESETLARPKQ